MDVSDVTDGNLFEYAELLQARSGRPIPGARGRKYGRIACLKPLPSSVFANSGSIMEALKGHVGKAAAWNDYNPAYYQEHMDMAVAVIDLVGDASSGNDAFCRAVEDLRPQLSAFLSGIKPNVKGKAYPDQVVVGQYHEGDGSRNTVTWTPTITTTNLPVGVTDAGRPGFGLAQLEGKGMEEVVGAGTKFLIHPNRVYLDPTSLPMVRTLVRAGGIELDGVLDDVYSRIQDGINLEEHGHQVIHGSSPLSPTFYIEKSGLSKKRGRKKQKRLLWFTPAHNEVNLYGFGNLEIAGGRAEATLDDLLHMGPEDLRQARDPSVSSACKLWGFVLPNPDNLRRADAYVSIFLRKRNTTFIELVSSKWQDKMPILPHHLQEAGVDVLLVTQRVGDLVIGGPGMSHFLVNEGHTIAMAWNTGSMATFHLPVRMMPGRDLHYICNWKTHGRSAWSDPTIHLERGCALLRSLEHELTQVKHLGDFDGMDYARAKKRVEGLLFSFNHIISHLPAADAELVSWVDLGDRARALYKRLLDAHSTVMMNAVAGPSGIGADPAVPESSLSSHGGDLNTACASVTIHPPSPTSYKLSRLIGQQVQSYFRQAPEALPLGKRDLMNNFVGQLSGLGESIRDADAGSMLTRVLCLHLSDDAVHGEDEEAGSLDWYEVSKKALKVKAVAQTASTLGHMGKLLANYTAYQVLQAEQARWRSSKTVYQLWPQLSIELKLEAYGAIHAKLSAILPAPSAAAIDSLDMNNSAIKKTMEGIKVLCGFKDRSVMTFAGDGSLKSLAKDEQCGPLIASLWGTGQQGSNFLKMSRGLVSYGRSVGFLGIDFCSLAPGISAFLEKNECTKRDLEGLFNIMIGGSWGDGHCPQCNYDFSPGDRKTTCEACRCELHYSCLDAREGDEEQSPLPPVCDSCILQLTSGLANGLLVPPVCELILESRPKLRGWLEALAQKHGIATIIPSFLTGDNILAFQCMPMLAICGRCGSDDGVKSQSCCIKHHHKTDVHWAAANTFILCHSCQGQLKDQGQELSHVACPVCYVMYSSPPNRYQKAVTVIGPDDPCIKLKPGFCVKRPAYSDGP